MSDSIMMLTLMTMEIINVGVCLESRSYKLELDLDLQIQSHHSIILLLLLTFTSLFVTYIWQKHSYQFSLFQHFQLHQPWALPHQAQVTKSRKMTPMYFFTQTFVFLSVKVKTLHIIDHWWRSQSIWCCFKS